MPPPAALAVFEAIVELSNAIEPPVLSSGVVPAGPVPRLTPPPSVALLPEIVESIRSMASYSVPAIRTPPPNELAPPWLPLIVLAWIVTGLVRPGLGLGDRRGRSRFRRRSPPDY